MPVCAVFGCKTNHKNIQGTGMKFYSFPRDPVYEKLWISACKRSDSLPKKPRICSLHFKEDSYHKPLIQTLLNYTPVTSRNLKPDAIPTENMPDESTLPGCKKSKKDSQVNKNPKNNKLFFSALEPNISVRSGVFLKSEIKNHPSIITESIQDGVTFNAQNYDVQDATSMPFPLLYPLATTSDTQVNGTMPEVNSLTSIEAKWRNEVGILCRLCTKSNYGCVPIFKGEGEKLELQTKIMKYLHIQVQPGDELPDHVCPVCLEAVIAWHEFAESCLNFDKELKELLSVNDKVSTFPVKKIKKKRSVSRQKDSLKKKRLLNIQPRPQNTQNSFAIILLGNTEPVNIIQEKIYENKTETIYRDGTENNYGNGTEKHADDELNTSQKCITDHDYASSNQEILKEVIVKCENVNVEDKTYKCNICSVMFFNFLQYAAHKMTAHKLTVDPNETEINMSKESKHSRLEDLNKLPEDNTPSKQNSDKENRNISHDKKRMTTCPVCCQQFKRLDFKRHILSHPGLCDKCFKIIPDKKEFEEHKLRHARVFVCETCGKGFLRKTNLRNHISTHLPDSEARKFKCPKCDAKFRWKRAIEIHNILKHSTPNVNVCPICDKKFLNPRYIKQHIKEIHSVVCPFKCQKCDKSFKNNRYLKQHEKTHSGIPRSKRKDNQQIKVKCDKCGGFFDSRIGLTLHSRTDCTLTTSRICYICGHVLKTSVQYHAHISKHKTKYYKCNFCDKSFFTKFERNVHVQRHKGERLYSCSICDKSFITKYNLIAHSTMHTNSKPFQCHICDKKFRQKAYLSEHIRVHNNDKRYTCEVCGMAFVKSCDMRKHMKTHLK